MTVSLDGQIAVVKREIHMRETNYPRWVAAGRMTQEMASYQLTAMRAVLATLEGHKKQGELL